ncbi:MAG: hypothetical protein Unbinned2404contig1000_1 [Prokaryotic dsDNA virus sp.]|nr:MAG: hypothetical protein Unbinned2404contig1000_1 [Prokaryotic dsDNA virus sp.]
MNQEADMKRSTQRMLEIIRTSGRKKFSYTDVDCVGCGEKISIYNYHLWRQTPCSCEDKKALFVEESQ